MPIVEFPYGKEVISYNIPDHRFRGELVSKLHHYESELSQDELIREAFENPIGTPKLSVMAEGKKNIVIIASDHTRPVPSKLIMPVMLSELRKGSPNAEITILISTGCHRSTTEDELINKFGQDIYDRENIVIHDCDESDLVYLGKLSSGGDLVLNKIAVDADLLVAEGFIEPHFFAGFSGGRKSVMPGVAGRKTVLFNHNAEFIAHPCARAGIIEGNPIHNDMLYACRVAGLAFICNVVINSSKDVVYAVTGDCDLAHRVGRDFLSSQCMVDKKPADIVITTNGGYPLDQNIYQAVKGMSAAEAAVNKGGVIIMLAKSDDGHGAPEFYKTFTEEKDPEKLYAEFLKTPKDQTRIDQWQSQIFARILRHASIIYISDAPDEMIRNLHMIPAKSLDEALQTAESILTNPNATITTIPDGIAVMVV